MKSRAPVAASPAPVVVGELQDAQLSKPELAPAAETSRLIVVPGPPFSPVSSGATLSTELDGAMLRELAGLRTRVQWLETELMLCGSDSASGSVADWLAVLLPEERPQPAILRLMVEYLEPYPVELTVDEGLWLAERISLDDWNLHGPTVDETLIMYLGSRRIASELTEEQLAPLLELWYEERYFR